MREPTRTAGTAPGNLRGKKGGPGQPGMGWPDPALGSETVVDHLGGVGDVFED
jgi:hypothetical protein